MIDYYINTKKQKEYNKESRDNFIFGLCLGLFIMILSSIFYISRTDYKYDKLIIKIFQIGIIILFISVIYPNILGLLKKIISPIMKSFGEAILYIILGIVYFILVCPLSFIVKKKIKPVKNSNFIKYQYNNNIININQKSSIYQILKILKFFCNEKYYIFIPVLVVLIILSIILIIFESSAIAPFIYTLF